MKILKQFIFINFTFLSLTFSAASADVDLAATALEPNENIPEEAFYVVHAMYKAPLDGKLIAGTSAKKDLGDTKKGTPLAGVVGWRPTLHFALGGIASDIDENTLSDRPFALIVPLSAIKSQVIGCCIYTKTTQTSRTGGSMTTNHKQCFFDDVYILDDLEIPNNSILIEIYKRSASVSSDDIFTQMKERKRSTLQSKHPNLRVVVSEEDLARAVLGAITELGGVTVSRESAISNSHQNSWLGVPRSDDNIIKSIKAILPQTVCYKKHDEHPIGIVDRYKMGVFLSMLPTKNIRNLSEKEREASRRIKEAWGNNGGRDWSSLLQNAVQSVAGETRLHERLQVSIAKLSEAAQMEYQQKGVIQICIDYFDDTMSSN